MARNGKGMMQLWEGMKIIMQSTRDEAGGEHGGCFPLFVSIATFSYYRSPIIPSCRRQHLPYVEINIPIGI